MTWTEFEAMGGAIGGWQRGDGDRLALVLHGGPGMTDYTEDLADEVAAGMGAGSRVVRYQQRGLTPSTLAGPFTVAQAVDDLIAVLDHLGAANGMLVGHSWGGHLAMHAACAHPERVSGLKQDEPSEEEESAANCDDGPSGRSGLNFPHATLRDPYCTHCRGWRAGIGRCATSLQWHH